MGKMLKKFVFSLLVVMMCLTMAPLQGFIGFDYSLNASAIDGTGKCGNDVYWYYNSSTNKLTISGSGPMHDYNYTQNKSPFYCSDIEIIVIEEGVTSIGNYAFYYCNSLTSITISDSVTNIGNYAFYDCYSLTDVYYQGIEERLNDIFIGYENEDLINATLHFKVTPVHTHSYTLSSTAPTCTAPGYTTYTCACGDSYVADKVGALGHDEVKVSGKPATCTATGLTDGKKCSVCGTVTVKQTAIAKKSHSYKTVTTKATLAKNGKTQSKCSVCGYVSKTTTIYYPKTVKLSATSYTYNGKTKTPTVTVKDSKGKILKKNTDYTVKYSKGRKAIGEYTVTVTFKGKYSGTKKLTFKIVPAKATLSKLTAGSKSFTAYWESVSGATGYELQYSTSSKFTSKTTKKVTVKSAKTKKITLKKLSDGKKYYVKLRVYKTVRGKKYYGPWSAVKSVKLPKDADYSAVLKEYKNAVAHKLSCDYKYIDPSWFNIVGAYYYALYDINSDGVKEFIVGNKSNKYTNIKDEILNIFTFTDRPVPLFGKNACFGERVCLEVYKNGIICVDGSSSAFESSFEYYKLPSNGSTLKFLEGYESEYYDYLKYYKIDAEYNRIKSVSKRYVESRIDYYETKKIKPSWKKIPEAEPHSSLTKLVSKAKSKGAYMAVAYVDGCGGSYYDIQDMFVDNGIAKKYPFVKDIPESRFFSWDQRELFSYETYVFVPVNCTEIKIYKCTPWGSKGERVDTIKDNKPFMLRGGSELYSGYIVEATTKDGKKRTYEAYLSAKDGSLAKGKNIYDFTPYSLLYNYW